MIHFQIPLHYQPEGVTWDIIKGLCGKVAYDKDMSASDNEKDVTCSECLDILIEEL